MKIKLGKYEHYKGGQYEVLGIAKHSETAEEFVLYKALYGQGEFWVRPVKMFLEEVNFEDKKIKRFKYIGNED